MSSIAGALSSLLSNPLSLLGAASPFIINSIQSHQGKLHAAEADRVAELAAATALAKEITEGANQIAYWNQEAMFGVVYRGLTVGTLNTVSADDKTAWETSRTAWSNWLSTSMVREARLNIYFGPAVAGAFSGINEQFGILTNLVNAAFFARPKSKYFIEDAVRDGSADVGSPWESSNLNYLVDLLGLDKGATPTLIAYLKASPPWKKEIPAKYQNDFRYKYYPIRENAGDDLDAFNNSVFSMIQSEQVGRLRKSKK